MSPRDWTASMSWNINSTLVGQESVGVCKRWLLQQEPAEADAVDPWREPPAALEAQ